MQDEPLINKQGVIFAVLILVLSFLLFLSDTREFFSSLTASLLSAALAWMSYVIVRWLMLAIRR